MASKGEIWEALNEERRYVCGEINRLNRTILNCVKDMQMFEAAGRELDRKIIELSGEIREEEEECTVNCRARSGWL